MLDTASVAQVGKYAENGSTLPRDLCWLVRPVPVFTRVSFIVSVSIDMSVVKRCSKGFMQATKCLTVKHENKFV
jgi:hypothetical protein